jgi:hypothetical protein
MAYHHQRSKIANLLNRFVRGDVTDWEFDDFLSIKNEDPILEKYRVEIGELPTRFPPNDPTHYTSSEGVRRILKISSELGAEML